MTTPRPFYPSYAANWHPDTLMFARQQSPLTRDAEWEVRATMPEPWWKLIAFGATFMAVFIGVIAFVM
jgi:hypothetical protein